MQLITCNLVKQASDLLTSCQGTRELIQPPGTPTPDGLALQNIVSAPLCCADASPPAWSAHLPVLCLRNRCPSFNRLLQCCLQKAQQSLTKELLAAASPPGGAWTRRARTLVGATWVCCLECSSSQPPPFKLPLGCHRLREACPWVPQRSEAWGSHSSLCVSVCNTTHIVWKFPPGSSTGPCLVFSFNSPCVAY